MVGLGFLLTLVSGSAMHIGLRLWSGLGLRVRLGLGLGLGLGLR